MDDLKKQRKSGDASAMDSSPAVSETAREPGGKKEITTMAKILLKYAFCTGAAMVAAGFILTIFAAWVFDIQDLPFKGEIRYGSDGRQTFYPYYPTMRTFAIVDNPVNSGSESQFSKVGFLGTSLFLYMVLNTFSWIMELGFSSFGGMILIPFLIFVVGATIFYFKLLPRSLQKRENALMTGLGIALIHTVVLMVVFFLGYLISPTFRSLFGRPYLYSGDMLSTLRTGIPLLFLTSFTYGAITGGILHFLATLHSALNLPPPNMTNKKRSLTAPFSFFFTPK